MLNVSAKSVLTELIRMWKFILLFTVLGTISAIVYYYYNPLQYKSTVSFMVDDDLERRNDQNLNDQSIYLAENAPNAVRLGQMIKSTEMLDYLIEKFNLYEHYNVSKQDPMRHEIVSEMLKSKINYSNSRNSGMSITMYGSDRELVAEIMNEMYVKLEEMINEYTVSNLKRKIKIYDEVLNNSESNLSRKSQDLKNLLMEFKNSVNETKKQKHNDLLYNIDMKLSFLSSQLSSINEDLLKTVKNYEISIANTNKENLPNIKLINVALKDTCLPLGIGLAYKLILSALLSCATGIIIVILNQQKKIQEKSAINMVIRPLTPQEN